MTGWTALRGVAAAVATGVLISAAAAQQTYTETPYFGHAVIDETMAPVEERLPETPLVETFDHKWQQVGKPGGSIRMLMRRAKDTRQMTVYGYARLMRYTPELDLQPDIAESIDVEDGRIFTIHLRPGHKWSDGAPFTAEDFRYWWEDIAWNTELYPVGPPSFMKAQGEYPKVDFIDDTTIRYTWSKPHPDFLPGLAKASPDYIYAPAHYLKKFHANYADPEELEKLVELKGQRSWASMHTNEGRLYRNDNPDLPTLQPWVVQTESPSNRFVFERNPYFHRVDPAGNQLPYVDNIIINISEKKLIPGKAATGDIDLQARYLRFDDFTLLKRNEKLHGYVCHLWRIAKGAHLALYPNMTHRDPVWRDLFREADFRRALSLAINRYEINRVIYFGLALEGQNTLLPGSPMYKPAYRNSYTDFDIERANALLDGLGLKRRAIDGMRRLPTGEMLEIIVETPGSTTEESDVLQLIKDSWRDIGVKMYIKPLSDENMRRRVYSGESQMVIASGMENGLATADMSPFEYAPMSQIQYQWSNFGQYFETNGQAGQAPDMPMAELLVRKLREWYGAKSMQERRRIWEEMLDIHADQVFTIGLVAGVLQPVVADEKLRNLPEEGMWNWDPGAHFGIYGLDKVWWDRSGQTADAAQ
ncbi:MAG: ABC transporter substrate-binding protein [Alphaproteobacteria bacterium]